MVIPPGTYIAGEVVFQGPCTANLVTVEVQGTIQAVPDLSLYPNGDWFTFEDVNGVVLKGGVFDAQGQNVWKYNDCKSNAKCEHLAVVSRTSNSLAIIGAFAYLLQYLLVVFPVGLPEPKRKKS